ncbi:MAG: hypothetical protein JO365_10000 [Bradyrhizobium sp.]|nr:hypothetical protein [Bradyrhizobium sp.]
MHNARNQEARTPPPRATPNRNGGRDHLGILGEIKSEYPGEIVGIGTESIPFARTGTYLCMEDPQISTLAESLIYRAIGYSVIGMTNMPEAKLARGTEIC